MYVTLFLSPNAVTSRLVWKLKHLVCTIDKIGSSLDLSCFVSRIILHQVNKKQVENGNLKMTFGPMQHGGGILGGVLY